MDKITKDFFIYLSSLGVSEKSLKFYKSDLSHFSGWITLKVKSLGVLADDFSQAIPFLNKEIALEYRKHLLDNSTPLKTINRRLSTIRHLGRFLLISEILPFDFGTNLTNIPNLDRNQSSYEVIRDFEKHLEEEKVSKNTIKNYLSDIRQFISWLEINH